MTFYKVSTSVRPTSGARVVGPGPRVGRGRVSGTALETAGAPRGRATGYVACPPSSAVSKTRTSRPWSPSRCVRGRRSPQASRRNWANERLTKKPVEIKAFLDRHSAWRLVSVSDMPASSHPEQLARERHRARTSTLRPDADQSCTDDSHRAQAAVEHGAASGIGLRDGDWLRRTRIAQCSNHAKAAIAMSGAAAAARPKRKPLGVVGGRTESGSREYSAARRPNPGQHRR